MEQYKKFEQNLKVFSGYITEPKIRYFDSGKCKCEFAIPLKLTKEDEPVFLNCECWGKIAEKASELKKGDEILVFGSFKEQEYTSKNGENKIKKFFAVRGLI